ncbi:MAG: N-acetyl-gamma-glutamyl-phosphate reductase [Flavobacteriales bacterium]|nr:N-acetyl-gamma-glutamyl-phosphate reductase [Flavobacteriales bacterium]
MNNKIKVGIIGGAGYTAGELIRILMYHPKVELESIVSSSNPNAPIDTIHDDLIDLQNKTFSDKLNGTEDVVFLCLGHGISPKYLEENPVHDSAKIIDLSNDFRLKNNRSFQGKEFIYGLPELNKEQIKNTNYLANPGCFATCIQLGLLPLAKENILSQDIHISAITGSTGAGRSLLSSTHFSWRNNNISTYKEFTHQHLGEITESLNQLQESFNQKIRFIPYRGDFTRGIFASIYTKFDGSIEDAYKLYSEYYKDEPFVFVSEKPIHMKQAVATNKCLIHLAKHDDQLLISSTIDNLVKGASGQAVQNMNLMYGWEETLGLDLKATYF